MTAEKSVTSVPGMVAPNADAGTASGPFSSTNLQVAGVDEADVVKTDGKYIYTYVGSRSAVSIVRSSDLTLMKTIALPSSFASVEMYLSNGKLVLVGQKYTSAGPYYTYRFFAPETKTIVAVYDVTTPESPKLERYNQIDGQYRDSRLIGTTLYFLSTTDLRLPPIYTMKYAPGDAAFDAAITKIENNFSLKNVVPQIREARK